MTQGNCSLCATPNQTVITASCKWKSHGVCYKCYYELADANLQMSDPFECFKCQGAKYACSGRYSLESIRAALSGYPDESEKFNRLHEAEARYVFIINKRSQEVLL